MDPLFARCFNIIEMVGKVKQLWLYNGALVDQLLWGNTSSLLLKDTLKFKTRLEISGIDIAIKKTNNTRLTHFSRLREL